MDIIKIITIGASSGGLRAINAIIEKLPREFAIPILIVQHLHRESDGFWIDLMNQKSKLIVKEAENNEPISSGTVYIAPPDYHLIIDFDKNIALSKDEKVSFSRPSIDVLFESASDVFGKNTLGIVLTGTNSDGSNGLAKIKKNGGITIAQDPAEAEFKEMPEAAIKKSEIDFILSLDEIALFLKKMNIII